MKSSIPKMQIHQHAQVQAQRSMRGGGGAGDSPRGRLRSGAPAGVCCVESQTKSFRFPKPQDRPGAHHRCFIFWSPGSILVQLGSLVGLVRPSCPTWLLLGSSLVHLCSNLAQLSANLAQLGPILAQLGSNLVQFWSQLAPTWTKI